MVVVGVGVAVSVVVGLEGQGRECMMGWEGEGEEVREEGGAGGEKAMAT